MKHITIAAALLLAGCAQIKFADGERVAIEHDPMLAKADVQAQADKACMQSGGRAPAVMVSDLPVTNVFPTSMTMHTATFRCAQ